MRDAILRARAHGAKSLKTILEDVPIAKILSEFKKFKSAASDDKFEHVELWTSDGGRQSKIKNIPTPKALKERKEREAKAKAEAEAKAKPTAAKST